MTRANIRWLLGPPEQDELFEGERLWIYDIGRHGSDCDDLVVRFAGDGPRVTGWTHRLLDE